MKIRDPTEKGEEMKKISNSANKEERAYANRHFLKLTCDWMQELAKMAYIIPKEENFRIEIESNSEAEEMTMKLILLDGT